MKVYVLRKEYGKRGGSKSDIIVDTPLKLACDCQ